LSRFGYCQASEEYRPCFGYSSAEEQAMFTGQSASRKVQNMSTEHDSFGFFLPSSLYLLFPLRVASYTSDHVNLRFTSAGLSIVDVNNQLMSTSNSTKCWLGCSLRRPRPIAIGNCHPFYFHILGVLYDVCVL
jgi:hypothetical protein